MAVNQAKSTKSNEKSMRKNVVNLVNVDIQLQSNRKNYNPSVMSIFQNNLFSCNLSAAIHNIHCYLLSHHTKHNVRSVSNHNLYLSKYQCTNSGTCWDCYIVCWYLYIIDYPIRYPQNLRIGLRQTTKILFGRSSLFRKRKNIFSFFNFTPYPVTPNSNSFCKKQKSYTLYTNCPTCRLFCC